MKFKAWAVAAAMTLGASVTAAAGQVSFQGHPASADAVKLAAGDMILYPASSLHRVAPVTAGSRWASFFWAQSMVRSDEQRTLLYDLDNTIQRLSLKLGQGDAEVVTLAGIYNNLLRMWAE